MALPLDIFDDESHRRNQRLSAISAMDSLYYQYDPSDYDDESGPSRSRSRGRSRSRSHRRRHAHQRSPEMEPPPIPPRSAARNQVTIYKVMTTPTGSVYSHNSQTKTDSTDHKASEEADGDGLVDLRTAASTVGKRSDIQAPRPAPPPPCYPLNNPDGGREAWLSVAGSWCGLFVSFGWISSIGIFQAYYQTHQLRDMSPAEISWICSLETFMMFAGGPIFGKMFDTYGVQPLLSIGSFLHVSGLILASASTRYYQFILTQGILSPVGASMIFYPSMANIATWFFKRKAFAFGVMASGSSVGGVVLPILVGKLLPQVGFAWSVRAAALLILLLCIVANCTITSRIEPIRRPLSLTEFVIPLTEVPYTLTAIGCFLFFMGLFLPFNFIVLQAVAGGMSPQLATYMPAILNGLSFFGRIGPGWAADYLGRYNIIIVMVLFCAVIDFALWIPADTNALIILYTAFYGFGTGAFVAMSPALIAQITSETSRIGVRTGTYFAIVSCAALIGNPIGGAIIDQWQGRFLGVQIFTGCVHLSAFVFLVGARLSLSGLVLREKV